MHKARKLVNAVNVRNKTVYDLGSGDGRIIMLAAKKGAYSTGVEIDPLRYLISLIKIRLSGLKNCRVLYGSFFKTNLKNADIVFMYLPQRTVWKLEKKFIKELGKNAVVVSYFFRCGTLKLVKSSREKIYVYKKP